MLDHKVSPLLDAMEVGECFASHDGASCYRILHPESGREFVLKHISVPANQEQVEALLLTGAYASRGEADAYYRKEAEGLVREAEARKKLLDCPYILPFLGVQMEKKEGVGYDVYAVLPKRNSLQSYLNENAVSHLRGINMGIDLCVALAALREEGYVHGNLKPGNVFFSDTGRFLLGDFGLISTEDMQYTVLPEQYRSSYSAPELSGYMGGLNTTVDIYSLGMILYRIYNGNHAPFEDEKTSAKAADARRVGGEALPAPIYADYELAEIILKACASDPAERFQSPEEMRIELEQYMRRNAVSDHLIVPPLVNEDAPLSPEAAAEKAEPVRFADPEKLDENFKKSFHPEEGKAPKSAKKEKKRKKDEEPLPISDQPILSDEPPQLAADRRRLAQKLKKAKQRRKRAWIIFAALMCVLVLLIGLYEFTDLGRGLWHYFVKVENMTVTDLTADSLRLRISTNSDPDAFTAYCQDAYGNSFTGAFKNGVTEFKGLNPNTQYSLHVELPGLHKLSGETAATAVTKSLAEILSFTAGTGSLEGSVRLELEVKEGSTEPAFWTLLYGKTGEEGTEIQFAGHSYQISGLENGTEYSFELKNTDKIFLSGPTTASFVPVPAVTADGLRLISLEKGEALLNWRCSSDLPEKWELRCTDPDGAAMPVELHEPTQEEDGWHCSATIPGILPDTSYQVRISAPGLYKPLELELRDDVITVESFTAESGADGISLHWSASREPEGGWLITAAFDEGMKLTDVVHGDSCILSVLPDTDYTITIAGAEGETVTGETETTARSQYNRRFLQMGLDQRTTLGTYYTPDKEEWSFADLGGGTIRYRHSDKITFVITAGGKPADSDETVTIQYVVRDARTDRVVNVVQEKAVWNSLWNGSRWFGQIPWLPEETGSYTFSVFVNSQRMGTIPFTLTE